MKKHSLRALASLLLLLFVFTASCNGQVETEMPNAGKNEPRKNTGGQSKLVKTQGTSPGANVHCGLQDRNGYLWFGTTGEGLYRFDGTSFTNFTVKDGLSDNNVWSVMEDNAGNIWFGTSDGACRYDGTTFTTIRVATTDGRRPFPSTAPNATAAVDYTVWCVVQDTTGNFWFGTPAGIYRYDGTSFVHLLDIDGVVDESGLHFTQVESILKDRNGNIWFGGRGSEGLFRFDGKSLIGFTPAGSMWMRPMLEDKAGNIWIGCGEQGAYRYDGTTFANIPMREIGGWVVSMVEEEGGNIWFAVDPGGVVKYDGNGKRLERFTTKDGLGNSAVFSVTIDSAKHLWVGTRGVGLFRYDGTAFTGFAE